ncbi:MAG: RNA-binding protein [Gammaproteobacteria bacterium]|nr:MAG: RNA-binding protein [Gammaproteobacteria bacterium]
MTEESASVRLDKWLWATRFYKTRKLALEAINGGKIRLNGIRPKPSKEVKIGAEIVISHGPYEKVLMVKGLIEKRVSAKVAVLQYEETPASIAKRELVSELYKMDRASRPITDGKPSKKERRQLVSIKREV